VSTTNTQPEKNLPLRTPELSDGDRDLCGSIPEFIEYFGELSELAVRLAEEA